MEEPERENIKLPFLQGCKTLCLTKTCTNCNHESLKVTHTILFTLQDTLERTVPFFSTLLIQHVFYEHSAFGFCLYCRLEYSVGMSVLIWCEQPQVPLWQQRAPCGLSMDVFLYNLKQGFSTWLPMGRWSICGSPKSLWASFSLLPSTWAVMYPHEVKVSVEGVSDSLTWGPSASRIKWGVLFLLAAGRSRKWPNCFPVLHFVAFHQSTESLMAFPLLFLICGTPSKSSLQSLKTL